MVVLFGEVADVVNQSRTAILLPVRYRAIGFGGAGNQTQWAAGTNEMPARRGEEMGRSDHPSWY